MDWYAILSVKKNASFQDIRRAYRQKALKYHPDKNHGKKAPQFDLIGKAYGVLSDPEQRAAYDETYKKSLAEGENPIRKRFRDQLAKQDLSQLSRNKAVLQEKVQSKEKEQKIAKQEEDCLVKLRQENRHYKVTLEAIILSERYQNTVYRELHDGSQVFGTVALAREFVDKNPTCKLKKSWIEADYTHKLEHETLKRIAQRNKQRNQM